MKKLFLICAILSSFIAISQPANDACGGAITSPQNGSCLAGTTAGAADNWVGTVGCQSGNNVEVWYTFVATGTQASFTVTGGTIGGNIELIFVLSSVPPCNGLSLAGSNCAASVLTSTFATTPGSTYYYTISSTGATGTFSTCVQSSSPPPPAGFDCASAAILCNSSSFGQGSSSSGFGTQEVTTSNSCWGSGGERQSKWFRFSVGCSGNLQFKINPVNSGDDYDWGVWDITSDPTGCTTKGNTIGCNWSGCTGSTGASSCANFCTGEGGTDCGPLPGCQASAWNAPIAVTAGKCYALLVDNFTTSNSGFNLFFGGSCGGGVVLGPNAAFTGVITDSPTPCMNLSVTKTCPISPTSNSTYLWNFGDGSTATTMNATHTYATMGNYNVSLTVTDLLGCSVTTSQAFNIGCVPLPVELMNFTGTKKHNGVNLLEWATATEKNSIFFAVERSSNAVDFVEIGRIKGAGNSNKELNYSFNDYEPSAQVSYYRLKMIDSDNKNTYSNVINIANENKDNISIAPNPANDAIVISFKCNGSSEEVVNIYDSKGNITLSKKLICTEGNNQMTLDISELKTGVYMVFVSLGNKLHKTRLIKN